MTEQINQAQEIKLVQEQLNGINEKLFIWSKLNDLELYILRLNERISLLIKEIKLLNPKVKHDIR